MEARLLPGTHPALPQLISTNFECCLAHVEDASLSDDGLQTLLCNHRLHGIKDLEMPVILSVLANCV